MPGYCRECGKPVPHHQRKCLPGWTYLPILAAAWAAAIWVLILLAKHQW